MDTQLRLLLRRYVAEPTLENADAFIRAMQRGVPPTVALQAPLTTQQARARSVTSDIITVDEVIEVSWSDIFGDDDPTSYSIFMDMLAEMVVEGGYRGYLQEIDWQVIDIGPYNQLFIRVTGYIECDCPGCDTCGSHCLEDCSSGDGEPCTAV